jgi:hypothetical protein
LNKAWNCHCHGASQSGSRGNAARRAQGQRKQNMIIQWLQLPSSPHQRAMHPRGAAFAESRMRAPKIFPSPAFDDFSIDGLLFPFLSQFIDARRLSKALPQARSNAILSCRKRRLLRR